MNKRITEYDDTKKMLNTLRILNESKYPKTQLKEQVVNQNDGPEIRDQQLQQTQPLQKPEHTINNNVPEVDSQRNNYDNIEVVNDVEVKLLSTDREDIKLRDDEKNAISQVIDSFTQQVSQLGDLDPGISVADNQIRLDGSIIDLDINFVYIVGEEAGFYINGDMLQINDNTIMMLGKLLKFNLTFTSSMEPLLKTRRTN